ncbi:MAG: glutathione S-transferase family protein [Kofleriaceae bacterium]|nr:glutathione S-transferase family protein [Myxococcales bacterium]MCB9565219.1 glutathione S-transferase family protein [Kofleriaceae bacterium]MCB9573357.1 glutathione S-transferase family protein [Kofleriaceae bacterium]
MKLFGTTTSPYVRRVRIAALEADVPFDLVDTATPDGQAALRLVSPIWKVPVIEVDGRILFDSRTICDWIVTTHGWGGLAAPGDRWHAANLLNAIDGALDSAIQVFYRRRDGHDVAAMPFAQRQRARIDAIFDWLDGEHRAGRFGDGAALGLAEMSLACTLDWMDFRDTYQTAGLFTELRAELATRPSVAATMPHA